MEWAQSDTAQHDFVQNDAIQNVFAQKKPVVYEKELQQGYPADVSAKEEMEEISVQTKDDGRVAYGTRDIAAVVVFGVWMTGVLALQVYILTASLRLKKRLACSICEEGNIYLAEDIAVPMVFGIIWPRIYLPTGMDELQKFYVISHERTHIMRKDQIKKLLAFVIAGIHWFNPLVWVAFKLLERDMEMTCDEETVRRLGVESKKEYAGTLLEISTDKRLRKSAWSIPLGFGEVDTGARIKNILVNKRAKRIIAVSVAVLCVVLLTVFLTKQEPTGGRGEADVVPQEVCDAAESYVNEHFKNVKEEYSDWRVSEIVPAYTYDDFHGRTLLVYLFNYEFLAIHPESILLAGGMSMGEDGWVVPGYPNSMYLVFEEQDGEWIHLTTMMENDCKPGDEIFTNDLEHKLMDSESENGVESKNNFYENIIAGLKDNESYALLEMDYKHRVLLISDLTYDYGTEKKASIYCEVYYPVDGEAKMIGTIHSNGTAYPITFSKDGIFAASGHTIEKYAISEEGILYLASGVYEQFDEEANVTYIGKTDGQDKLVTVQEYQAMVDEYGGSRIVHFSNEASDSVNEYYEKEIETPVEVKKTVYWQETVENYEVSLRDGTEENMVEVIVHKGDREWSICSYDISESYHRAEDITMDTFEGIMGQNGFRIYECYSMGNALLVCQTDYYSVGEEPIHLGHSWTTMESYEEDKTPNVYEVDLDGDGITELLCNVQWLADGAVDTNIYHWDGKQVYTFGGTDVMMAETSDIQTYGVGSVGAKYLPEKNKILAWHWDEATQSFVEKEYEIDMSKLEMWEFQ